ncbi:MAG: rod shape-determining protein RodA [Anaerolineales bacterium]|nr:rod shape-determining protein RodA [Anaerolineales bacterium]
MSRETFRHFDFWLLGAVAVLTVFGIAMIWSSMAGNEVLLEVFPRQIIFSLVGFGVVIAVASVDYHLFNPASRLLYVAVLGLLILVQVAGVVSGGAARWLDTGFFFIQPSELAKIVIILILADYFSRTESHAHDLAWIARSLAPTLGLLVLIFIQPDLDTSIVIVVIWFTQLWASGLPMRYVFLFAILGVLLSFAAFPFLEQYQQDRIITFLFPNSDARFGNEYNINQALISIGSGGLFGQGYGQASQVQLRFLKVRHTDFIFAASSEEFGMVGGVLIILTLSIIIWRCIRAAQKARDVSGSMLALGIATLIFFQGAVNIGMNLNLLPVSGLPLPFISYGGSGLTALMIGIGLVESVVMRRKDLEF